MEVSGQLHAPAALLPMNQLSVPIGYEAEWAPEPVWTLWRREKSAASALPALINVTVWLDFFILWSVAVQFGR
jgi:hypothetical protein